MKPVVKASTRFSLGCISASMGFSQLPDMMDIKPVKTCIDYPPKGSLLEQIEKDNQEQHE